MNDPLASILRVAFGLFGGDPAALLLEIICLGMLSLFFMPNLLDVKQRIRERRIACQCRAITKRIDSLLPAYEQATKEMLDDLEKSIEGNSKVVELAATIPSESKLKGERDFCLLDARGKDAIKRISLLQMEAGSVFK